MRKIYISENFFNSIDVAAQQVAQSWSNIDANSSRALAAAHHAGERVAHTAKIIGLIGAVTLASMISKGAYQFYRSRLYGECAKVHGRSFYICRLKVLDATIRILKREIKKCANSKDPKVCRENVKETIDKLQREKDKVISHIRKFDI